ncbi:hypothetical protein [Cellulomonas xiejunii]|uniref:Uncharacterized protein n=1 Tax=Cellulomonas xiejunii TaxID=2968083 RepID=A0ABY5KSB3_9CELL|nr:hypothetical protein [Cellulomonas xiejunii]MCC2315624.1 hypothetical protein [Cellulomonas xiejunii]MCC2322600.1 hypothetical protein [Cellulomonas xiejunii]UUI72633.1 hypothetical protein NP048_04020 [Cellulomonas xiejunii]
MPRLVQAALDKAVTIPSASIHAHVESVRRRNPGATPEQIVHLLEKEFLLLVAGAGGAVGAAAAAPIVGTGLATVLTVSDVATFFGASAAFSLAVASVHGIEVTDTERRKALLLTTLLGESSNKVIGDTTDLATVRVGKLLLTRMPMGTVKKVNNQLTRRLVRKQAAKFGGLALGRLAPYGIGAAIGVAGGRALGQSVIKGARLAFGPAPATFPRLVEVDAGNVVPADQVEATPPAGKPDRRRRLLGRRR